MPSLRITAADGQKKVVSDGAGLQAEINKFEEALQALIPDLESSDVEAGRRAIGRYRILAYNFDALMQVLDWWNEEVKKEERLDRQKLAAALKPRHKV